MIELALEPIANQQFTVLLDGNRYDFMLKEANGIMAATIVRDGETILQNSRVVAGWPIIPYRYLAPMGNFVLLTENDELPDWQQFASTQSLLYISRDEL